MKMMGTGKSNRKAVVVKQRDGRSRLGKINKYLEKQAQENAPQKQHRHRARDEASVNQLKMMRVGDHRT